MKLRPPINPGWKNVITVSVDYFMLYSQASGRKDTGRMENWADRSWKQPKCPSTDEWIKKMWCIYTMEHYSAIKRNEIGSFVEMWLNLETVILSEVSQKEKNKYRMLTHICGI